MSLDSVPSNTHGGLDEQISQLMQCKPLSEQEVLYIESLIFDGFLSVFVVGFCGWFLEGMSRIRVGGRVG